MLVVTQICDLGTRVIGVVKDESEIPKGILEQEDIEVLTVTTLPNIPSGYSPFEVFIDRKGSDHEAYKTSVHEYVNEEHWTNEHTVHSYVLAETPEKAIAQVNAELHREHA